MQNEISMLEVAKETFYLHCPCTCCRLLIFHNAGSVHRLIIQELAYLKDHSSQREQRNTLPEPLLFKASRAVWGLVHESLFADSQTLSTYQGRW